MRNLFLIMVFFALQWPLPAAASTSEVDSKLLYVASLGRAEDVKILLERGANVNAMNETGWTPLALACDRKDDFALGIVKLLVEAGAEINKADKTKSYPLINAVRNENFQVTNYLLEKGADYSVKDASGNAALDIATRQRNEQIAGLLKHYADSAQRSFAEERSLENLTRLTYDMAFKSCAAAYFQQYIQDNQGQETAYQPVMLKLNEQSKAHGAKIVDLFKVDAKAVNEVYVKAGAKVTSDLEWLGEKRKSREYGSEDDVKLRCDKIARMWKINVPDQQKLPRR